MSKEDAMVEFVKLLNKCCPLLSAYVASHRIEKEEEEKRRWCHRARWHTGGAVHWCSAFWSMCSGSDIFLPTVLHFYFLLQCFRTLHVRGWREEWPLPCYNHSEPTTHLQQYSSPHPHPWEDSLAAVAQVGLLNECWDYTCALPHLATFVLLQ